MKQWCWAVLLALGGALVSTGFAADNLDSLKGRGWSPNNRWFAFNPVNQDYLFVASVTGHRNFVLKPVGQVVIDTSNVFASEPTSNSNAKATSAASDGITMFIGSPGRNRLEAIEWSPDGITLAYSYERKKRATFSVFDQTVTGTYSISNQFPWCKSDHVHLTFDYERALSNRPAQYALRVVGCDGSVVKEHLFRDPKEITRISLLRNTDSDFITPDGRHLIYPQVVENSWQLMIEDLEGTSGPRPLMEAVPAAPYEWKLTKDGKYLAVVEGATSLAIGPVENFAQAEHVAFSNQTFSVAWSPDGRFLACNDKQQLYLLEFARDTHRLMGNLNLVSSDCNPQFWGWRGTRLLFGDPKQLAADLFSFDTATDKKVVQLVHSKNWQSAPFVRTISPDGTMFICVVMEIDGSSHLVREIWKTPLQSNAEWELLERSKPNE